MTTQKKEIPATDLTALVTDFKGVPINGEKPLIDNNATEAEREEWNKMPVPEMTIGDAITLALANHVVDKEKYIDAAKRANLAIKIEGGFNKFNTKQKTMILAAIENVRWPRGSIVSVVTAVDPALIEQLDI